jgi:hypothetical protein
MKTMSLFLVLLFFSKVSITSQNGTCNVTYKNKYVFFNSIPTDAYTVVGKTKYPASGKNDAATSGDVSGVHKVCLAIDDMIEKVGKGKQADFDAVIIYGINKIELIKYNSPNPTKQCTYNVKEYMKKCGAKTIYFLGLPTKTYTVVKTIEVTNFSNIGQFKMGKDEIDNFINKLYERSCKEGKEGVDFDAIIMDDPDMATKKGFVGGRTIQLIKFQ